MEPSALLPDVSQMVRTARDVAAAEAAARPRAGVDAGALRRAAEDFEAVFLSQMLAPMFEGLGDDPLFGGGPGATVYRSMLVEEYGKAVARSGGLGIADAVQQELLKLQEGASP